MYSLPTRNVQLLWVWSLSVATTYALLFSLSHAHSQMFVIYSSLHDPGVRKMSQITEQALYLILTLYLVVSVLTTRIFGSYMYVYGYTCIMQMT